MPVLIALLICVILIVIPAKIKVAISGFITSYVYYPFNQMDNFLIKVASAQENNVRLNQQLVDVSIKASQYTEDHYENMRLRRMLDFDLQLPHSLVPAEVIGLRPGQNAKSIIINVGVNKGITRNMPVITADGIVGKTIEVSANTSVIQLLADHNCKVSAIDQDTRAMGIIRWRGGKLLEMGDVPVESNVAVGDTIISSGLGGIFPPSLMVGTVVFAEDKQGTLFKDVYVKPAVDFSTLEEVFVVIHGE